MAPCPARNHAPGLPPAHCSEAAQADIHTSGRPDYMLPVVSISIKPLQHLPAARDTFAKEIAASAPPNSGSITCVPSKPSVPVNRHSARGRVLHVPAGPNAIPLGMVNVINRSFKEKKMEIFSLMEQRGHEEVVFIKHPESGLRGIIAIHNTSLGPALGGTRMWNYETEAAALNDVLRLSRGMTYKAAAAGLNLGGGKAVIIGDPKTQKNEKLFRAFGRFIQGLGGRYITAEDVGTSVRDMEWVRMETDFVTGIDEALGGSGDPSPVTAMGTFYGMKASAKKMWGSDSLSGKKVAVQGLGHVGYYLVRHLCEEGAEVIVTDIDKNSVKRVVDEFKVKAVEPDEIYAVHADIFSPCALGAIVNDETLPMFKFKIIAGASNNQLAVEEKHGEILKSRGILYAPDYVINAGGLINVANELEGYQRERSLDQAKGIYNILLEVFEIAERENIPTYEASNRLAEKRIRDIEGTRRIHTLRTIIPRDRARRDAG